MMLPTAVCVAAVALLPVWLPAVIVTAEAVGGAPWIAVRNAIQRSAGWPAIAKSGGELVPMKWSAPGVTVPFAARIGTVGLAVETYCPTGPPVLLASPL